MAKFYNPHDLVDLVFTHAWEGTDGVTRNYYGRITDEKVENNKQQIIVGYWLADKETEEESEDFDIGLVEWIHDICVGEVVLLEM